MPISSEIGLFEYIRIYIIFTKELTIHIVISFLAPSAIVLGRFGPAVAAEASSQVLQRPLPIGDALCFSSYLGFIFKQ